MHDIQSDVSIAHLSSLAFASSSSAGVLSEILPASIAAAIKRIMHPVGAFGKMNCCADAAAISQERQYWTDMMSDDGVTLASVTEVGPLQAGLTARYGDDGAALAISSEWNPVLETLLNHRSVRRYSSEPLPPGLLELLAAAAQSAPSSSNLQAFSIVAVEDADRKRRLSKLAAGQKHVADAPLLLMFVADLARLRQVTALYNETAEGLDYTESFLIALTDAAFGAQNTLVALESLGLGACYIGAMRNHPEEVAKELALPPGTFVVFGMTIGYPDLATETGIKPRLPQSVVLHREQYGSAPPVAFDFYDKLLREFRLDQQMSDLAWTKQTTDRVRRPESLMGRQTLRQTLQSRGLGQK